LVAADVDLFKQINDRYGHQAGDQVLRRLSALLLEQFPAPSIVGRIGGEEFAIFLPDHNRLQAYRRISEFRDRIRPIEFEGHSIEVTLSFGLTESRKETRLERLRARADHALYRAKRAGRNQVIDAADTSRY
ncbi:MAG: GGDEF domain-containing protein, partial [Wenzhouxiangellaceae bacterium]